MFNLQFVLWSHHPGHTRDAGLETDVMTATEALSHPFCCNNIDYQPCIAHVVSIYKLRSGYYHHGRSTPHWSPKSHETMRLSGNIADHWSPIDLTFLILGSIYTNLNLLSQFWITIGWSPVHMSYQDFGSAIADRLTAVMISSNELLLHFPQTFCTFITWRTTSSIQPTCRLQ